MYLNVELVMDVESFQALVCALELYFLSNNDGWVWMLLLGEGKPLGAFLIQ